LSAERALVPATFFFYKLYYPSSFKGGFFLASLRGAVINVSRLKNASGDMAISLLE
jgi:hypothetical protein